MSAFGERFATAHDVMCVRAMAFAAKWAAVRGDARAFANARFARRVADALARLDPRAYGTVTELRVAAREILARTPASTDGFEARAELAAVIEAI